MDHFNFAQKFSSFQKRVGLEVFSNLGLMREKYLNCVTDRSK